MDDELKRPYYRECDGFLIPGAFSPEAFHSAVNYKPKPGQIFIVTHPKCGTTWMQQITFLILRKGKPADKFSEVFRNSPYLELTGVDAIDFMQGPGTIKTHLPFNLVPYSSQAKYIYVARNPRDCCVSFYFHTKDMNFYNFSDGTFDEYFEIFIKGRKDYGDYFDHLLSWYRHREDPNVLFLTYEDLHADLKEQIMKIAKFMGGDYYDAVANDPTVLKNIIKYSSIEYMKKHVNEYIEKRLFNPDGRLPSGIKAVNEYMLRHFGRPFVFKGEFVRKGIVGDWKNYFSRDQEKKMEKIIKEKTVGSDVMDLWK